MMGCTYYNVVDIIELNWDELAELSEPQRQLIIPERPELCI